MGQKGDRREARGEARFRDIPAWARDNLFLKMLDDHGFRIRVVYDQRYLNGLSDKPLIVIRRKRDAGDSTDPRD